MLEIHMLHKLSRCARSLHFTFLADAIMNTSYMNVLASIRLFLLLFPLAYHSYTGTAVKCPAFYHLFYSVSLMVLLGHMLAIIMLDPDSLTSLLPTGDRLLHSKDKVVMNIMRHVWIELSLSVLSTTMHCMLLWHVRSTAPYPYEDVKRRKRVLYFYAQQQQLKQQGSNGGSEENGREMMPLSSSESSHRRRLSNDLIEQMKLIPEGYDGRNVCDSSLLLFLSLLRVMFAHVLFHHY